MIFRDLEMTRKAQSTSLYTTILQNCNAFGHRIVPLSNKKPFAGFTLKPYLNDTAVTDDQLSRWFVQGEGLPHQPTSYGIICGRVQENKYLIVFDFDSKKRYREFCEQFPEIARTYTVATYRGYHAYFFTKIPIRYRKFNGGELISEGHYVVGSGSTIKRRGSDGKQITYKYKNIGGFPVMHLDREEIAKILRGIQGEEKGQDKQVIGENRTGRENPKELLRTLYWEQAPLQGRNNALYATARYAGQSLGIEKEVAFGILAPIHVKAEPYWDHPKETETQRVSEAYATIASAYKERKQGEKKREPPAGRRGQQIDERGVPNDARETLLKEQGTSAGSRVLDAIMGRWSAGETVAKTEIMEYTRRCGISSREAHAVLEGRFSKVGTQRIIKETPPPVGYTDKSKHNVVQTGRPRQKFYVIPSPEEICQRVGVKRRRTDYIPVAALSSDKAYRMAMHRAFIKRRGMVEKSMRWMAERLSVSVRTLQRYHNEMDVIRLPVFEYVEIDWDNVDSAMFTANPLEIHPVFEVERRKNGVTPGFWLQNPDGERWPAIAGLACKLLSHGHKRLVACRRRPSRLTYVEAHHGQVIWRSSGGIDRLSGPYKIPQKSDTGPPVRQSDKKYPQPHTRTMLRVGSDDMSPNHGITYAEVQTPLWERLPRDPKGREIPWNLRAFDTDANPVFQAFEQRTLLTINNVRDIVIPMTREEAIEAMRERFRTPPESYAYVAVDGKIMPAIPGLIFKVVFRTEARVELVELKSDTDLMALKYREGLYRLREGRFHEALNLFQETGLLLGHRRNIF